MSQILPHNNFYKLNRAFVVRIPRIQRDYAQGRAMDAKVVAVRRDFIDTLINAIQAPEASSLCMDFIYGEVSDHGYLPLDGQQRLTTLFLLHWLLAPKSLCEEGFRGFQYESRRPAMSFCDHLQASVAPTVTNVSANLKTQPWFRQIWLRDQTVAGMLVMLDEMQAALIKREVVRESAWQKLCVMPAFQCLQTNDCDGQNDAISDQIYVKMNSRGVPLTAFEIIKSNLQDRVKEKIILADDWILSSKEIRDYFDNHWLNFFYGINPSNFDQLMARHIATHFYLMNFLSSENNGSNLEAALLAIAKKPEEAFHGFLPFDQVLHKDVQVLAPLFRFWEVISHIPAGDCWFSDALTPSWPRESNSASISKFEPPETVALYAVQFAAMSFPFRSKEPEEEEKQHFRDWMRICWNIIQHSSVTTEGQELGSAIKLIHALAGHVTEEAGDVHGFFQKLSEVKSNYASKQLDEEFKKVALIRHPENGITREMIVEAESHQLCRGRIAVLLEREGCFLARHERLITFFPIDRSGRDSVYHDDLSLIRAVFVHCDLKQPFPNKRNDTNWRRILDVHRSAFGAVLDDPDSPEEQCRKALKSESLEYGKRIMLTDDAEELWNYGKYDSKGIAMIENTPHLFKNAAQCNSAIPLHEALIQIWRTLTDDLPVQGVNRYPHLNDYHSVAITHAEVPEIPPRVTLFLNQPMRDKDCISLRWEVDKQLFHQGLGDYATWKDKTKKSIIDKIYEVSKIPLATEGGTTSPQIP